MDETKKTLEELLQKGKEIAEKSVDPKVAETIKERSNY